MPNIFSRLKANIKSKATNIKKGVQEWKKNLKENFEEARSKPRSKRKSFGEVCPAPTSPPALTTSNEIIKKLSGAAGSIFALAVSSGSYALGALCGIIVAIGILKFERK